MSHVSSYRNKILDTKLTSLSEQLEKKEAQMTEVLQRADLDQRFIQDITKKVEETMESKNQLLKNLK